MAKPPWRKKEVAVVYIQYFVIPIQSTELASASDVPAIQTFPYRTPRLQNLATSWQGRALDLIVYAPCLPVCGTEPQSR